MDEPQCEALLKKDHTRCPHWARSIAAIDGHPVFLCGQHERHIGRGLEVLGGSVVIATLHPIWWHMLYRLYQREADQTARRAQAWAQRYGEATTERDRYAAMVRAAGCGDWLTKSA